MGMKIDQEQEKRKTNLKLQKQFEKRNLRALTTIFLQCTNSKLGKFKLRD